MTEIVESPTAAEARVRETSFLSNLANAQDDYEWIVEHQAWTTFGFDRFADWWTARVQPLMHALQMRPNREIATRVIEQVRAEEAQLPPAQQRTQRELAELIGGTRDDVRDRTARSTPRGIPPHLDLEQDSPSPSGVGAGNEGVPAADETPAPAGTRLDSPRPWLSDDPTAVEDARRRRLSDAFATSLQGVMLALDPDPVAWLARTWEPAANPYRSMRGARDTFTTAGVRRAAEHLARLADHLDKNGGSLL